MKGRIGDTLESTPAINCMKFCLMVFNFLFLVSGLAILALGIWMKVQLYIYIQLTDIYYDQAPYVLMGIGGGIVVVGSLGCLCTVKGKAFFLYLFAAFLVIVFIAELSVGIAGFVYRGKLEEGFKNGMLKAMQTYNSDPNKKKAMDDIQHGIQCCGRMGYKEWFDIDFDGTGKGNKVPDTCCKPDRNPCKHTNLPQNATQSLDIYTQGCFTTVTSFVQKNFGIMGGVAIGFAFLQLWGAFLACCLAKGINKNKYEQMT